MHPQDEAHQHSLKDPESFWGHQAEQLHWHKKPDSIISRTSKTLESGTKHPSWEWFPGGELSNCYNCLDRHVLAGNGDQPAIYYDSPVTTTKQTFTYAQLLDEVEVLAGVLRDEGVKRGDVVLLYMPMIPAALIGILAINRLGAVHAVVFGGFAASSLAQRIEASKAVAILTASCGIDGAKPPISYKPLIREAIQLSKHKPERVLVWQRNELRWDPLDKLGGERNWFKLVRSARARGIKADCVPVKSSDPIYIIYTSGTTGSPKGVVRDAAGHAVGLHLSISYLFGVRGPGDVIFTARSSKVRVGNPLAVKPGSAGKPMPGFDVRVVDDKGNELSRGKMGNIVMSIPLAPTGFRTLWTDEVRFYRSYLKRFDGKWLDTGDAGMIDSDGYISIMSRSDDLINTAGHRLSTGAIEQAITSHPLVAEASVIGIPDNLKGQLPFAFITLSVPDHPSSAVPDQKISDEIQKQVRSQIGGIATLGGIIQGKNMIPRTRSGKTLRRVLRELVENAVHGEFDKEVTWPATIEDVAVIDVARSKVAEYFKEKGTSHKAIEERAKL
ncbi:hypothetical protein KJ359_013170 [Pestalotiopsis sp. 9143b]|nr:hypothetical protein KJ359_013170 [Pestalotiopsis sp. 9143b]